MTDTDAQQRTAPARGDSESGQAAAAPRRRRSPLIPLYIASLLLGIGLWWLLAETVYADNGTLPSPAEVAETFYELLVEGDWWRHTWASLQRVLLGFVGGVVLAVPAGFLMGWYLVARGLVEPWIQFFRTIPPLALIPLVIVFLGIGETAKVSLIFLAAFLVVVIATFQGVRGVDKTLINAARVLGAGDFTVFRRVVVPAAFPYILTGARIALGSSWATLVAAELIAANSGLGYLMSISAQYFNIAAVIVGIITIGFFGFVMDRMLLLAEERLTYWQERREA